MSSTVGHYLTVLIFEVEGHRFALDTSQIVEIVRAVQPTRLAQAPDIVEGVINVRGQLAPVIDLRARFDLTRRPIVPSDVLVLCSVGPRLFALRADLTHQLETVSASALAASSPLGRASLFAKGAVTTPEGVLLICDLAAFLSEADELALARALAHHVTQEVPA